MTDIANITNTEDTASSLANGAGTSVPVPNTQPFPEAEEFDLDFPADKINMLPGGGSRPYVRWQDLVSLLNHRFGADGWTSEVVRNNLVFNDVQQHQKHNENAPVLRRMVAAEAVVRLTIKVGGREIVRSAAAGFSSLEDYSKSGGMGAVEMALKSAPTNAFKRAAAMLGPAWSPAGARNAPRQGEAATSGPSPDSPFSAIFEAVEPLLQARLRLFRHSVPPHSPS